MSMPMASLDPDGIAVGTRVRAHKEALAAADKVENGGLRILRHPSQLCSLGWEGFDGTRVNWDAGIIGAGIEIHRAHPTYSATFLWRLRERSINSSMRD